MKFYVVTPSYNQADWLLGCLKSVVAQAVSDSITVHHHVQDACSTDGTLGLLEDWKKTHSGILNYSFSYTSESDDGMYDAVNRGWSRAADLKADIISYINCDEQYMPRALATIATCFDKHRQTDVVLADMIVIDRKGDYVCHRRSIQPYRLISRFCCECLTATTFLRMAVFKDSGVRFDTRWKNFGDKVWYNALLESGMKFQVCNEFIALFTITGSNKGWTEEGTAERLRYKKEHNFKNIDKYLAKLIALRRMMRDIFHSPPRQYPVYIGGCRLMVSIDSPTCLWRKKF